jgi:hypothetical protein
MLKLHWVCMQVIATGQIVCTALPSDTMANAAERSDLNKHISMGCKWAAITCVVVTVPLIGKTAQVSLERTIGTVTGGILGFFVFEVCCCQVLVLVTARFNTRCIT